MRGPRWCATSSSTSRCCRGPAGSSTTRSRSGSGRRPSCRPRSARPGIDAGDLAAVGITNQRETTFVWDRRTGRPLHNAIVWQDTRTDGIAAALDRDGRGDTIRHRAGLPPATYFSGGKLQWILEHVDGVREAAERGDALFGTADTWLLWHLTGGPDGGVHVTDVTNASRTMLMDLETLDWDDELLGFFGVPRAMLPQIRESSASAGSGGPFGVTRTNGPFGGEVPLTGILGDQQAATVGQVCFAPGEAKNTYGTGNFMLLNTGTEIVRSKAGLLTTPAYRFGDEPCVYALEGSIAVTGSAVQWLRDQLGIISGAAESESLARQVDDNGGVYFVPAFSGLFAPYWRSDARGAIVGLSRFNTNAHLARATLEAICYQSRDVVEAMCQDSGVAARGAQGRRGSDPQQPLHADPGRRAGRAGEPARRTRDDRARRGVRRRPLGRVLARHRRAARQLGRGHPLGADLGRDATRGGLRALEEGRGAHPRLGRRLMTPAALSPRARSAALKRLGDPAASTCSSSVVAWSAPAARSTRPPAGSRSGWSRRATSRPARPAGAPS